MAIFRADEDSDDDENESEDEIEEIEDEDYDPYYQEVGGHNAAEKERLNNQRLLFSQDNLDDDDDDAEEERQVLDEVVGQDQSSRPSRLRSRFSSNRPKSKRKKRLLVGIGIFILPTLIGLSLFFIALQAGFTLEHISRVTTGLRFGSTNLMLSRRFNHLRREYVRLAEYQTPNQKFARYTKTTLGSRLLGVTPDKIYRTLNKKGYKFKFATFEGGAVVAKGRSTLTKVTHPNGRVQEIKSSSDALEFLRSSHNSFDDFEVSRFRATRSSLLLAKQIGIPFLRFRVIIDGLRSGSLKNSVRGSPVDFVQQRITEDLIDGKQRLAERLPKIQENLSKFEIDELAEIAKTDASSNLAKDAIIDDLRNSLDSRQKILKTAVVGSVIVGIITIACVIREIGSMIRDAFKMKTRGLQDTAATLETTTSQIRAGDMSGEIVSDMTKRYEGFSASANYQVAVQGESAANLVGVEGSDFSEEFSPAEIFDGWAVAPLFKFSNLLNPVNFLATTLEYVKSNTFFLGGLIGKAASLVKDEIGAAVSVIEKQFGKACKILLNPAVQIGVLAFEVLATIIASIFSGGLAGGVQVGSGQIVKEVGKVLAQTIILGFVGGVALDILLFDYLLPGMVYNATGLDTALLSDGSASSGARNYAAVDYGMHYLSSGEALGNGASSLPVETAVAQTQTYLAQQRQEYAEKGLFNNIFASDNPYSLTSSLMVAQNTSGSWQQKSQTYAVGLFDRLGSNLDFFEPAYAQDDDDEALKQILYPGQTFVAGFHEEEMTGASDLFSHEINTLYVENNIDQLKDEYSSCIGIEVSEYLLSQVGEKFDEYGHEYYPEKCDHVEARRYKTYYQDCTLIESIRLWGSDSSPMFSSHCDHLLSLSDQDTLNEPLGTTPADLEIEETSLFNEVTDQEFDSGEEMVLIEASSIKDPSGTNLVRNYSGGLPSFFSFGFVLR